MERSRQRTVLAFLAEVRIEVRVQGVRKTVNRLTGMEKENGMREGIKQVGKMPSCKHLEHKKKGTEPNLVSKELW